MNVRTFTGCILAVVLFAPTAGAIAAGQSGQPGAYAEAEQAVMTTTSNTEMTRHEGNSVVAMDDTMLPARHAVDAAAALATFRRCGTLTFSADGHYTSISTNMYAEPFLSGETAFVCRTY